MWRVHKAGGKMVPGLASRNGHRYNQDGVTGHGDARVKNEFASKEKWLDYCAKEVKIERHTHLQRRDFIFDGSSSGSEDDHI